MDTLVWLVVAALAIDDLSDILTGKDAPAIIAWPRGKFQSWLPTFAKLAECKYCQSLWLSIPAAAWLVYFPDVMPARMVILVLAMHRAAQFFDEFFDRYRNRAPASVYANVNLTAAPIEVKTREKF